MPVMFVGMVVPMCPVIVNFFCRCAIARMAEVLCVRSAVGVIGMVVLVRSAIKPFRIVGLGRMFALAIRAAMTGLGRA